jgi:hypothetical protein
MNILDFAAQVIFISVSGVLAPGPLFFANLIYGSKLGFHSGIKIASGHTIVELTLIILLALGIFGFSSFTSTNESIRIIGLIGGTAIICFSISQISNIIKGRQIIADWTYNQSAITPGDRDEYIKQYSKPGALRAGFEYYRAVFEDAEQNKEYAKEKLRIPILTIGGEAGVGNFTTTTFQMVANNVTGITLPNTGHFIPEERPNVLIKYILEFFK